MSWVYRWRVFGRPLRDTALFCCSVIVGSNRGRRTDQNQSKCGTAKKLTRQNIIRNFHKRSTRRLFGGLYFGPLCFLFFDGFSRGRIASERLYYVAICRLPDLVRVVMDNLFAHEEPPRKIPRFRINQFNAERTFVGHRRTHAGIHNCPVATIVRTVDTPIGGPGDLRVELRFNPVSHHQIWIFFWLYLAKSFG